MSANTITDCAALLDAAGYKMEQTGALRNMPVVPDKSTAMMRLNGESADLHRAWYRGQVAKFFSFAEAPLAAGSERSAVADLRDLQRQSRRTEWRTRFRVSRPSPNSEQTHNVPFTLPGDAGYSPLWLVAVYDNADFPSVHDRATALKAKVLAPGAATVNCPIVFVTP